MLLHTRVRRVIVQRLEEPCDAALVDNDHPVGGGIVVGDVAQRRAGLLSHTLVRGVLLEHLEESKNTALLTHGHLVLGIGGEV